MTGFNDMSSPKSAHFWKLSTLYVRLKKEKSWKKSINKWHIKWLIKWYLYVSHVEQLVRLCRKIWIQKISMQIIWYSKEWKKKKKWKKWKMTTVSLISWCLCLKITATFCADYTTRWRNEWRSDGTNDYRQIQRNEACSPQFCWILE